MPRIALCLLFSLLAGCASEPSCDDDGTQFLMTGSETRYATDVSLLIEQDRVVGVRGRNDRGQSFVLRAAGSGVDLSKPASYSIETFPEGVIYDECTGGQTPEQCTFSAGPRKLRMTASAGTLVVEAAEPAYRARFELRGARRVEPSAGDVEASGCLQAPAREQAKDAGAD